MAIRIGVSAVAAALMISMGPAAASDLLASRPIAQMPALEVPVVSPWSGAYVGLHLGGLSSDWTTHVGFTALSCGTCGSGETRSATFKGPRGHEQSLVGGVQAGYNWQTGALVYGLEADGSVMDADDARTFEIRSSALVAAGLGAITDPQDGFVSTWRSSIDGLASVRGRVGLARGPFLVYATGGLAVAQLDTRVSYLSVVAQSGGPTIVPVLARDSTTEVGWTVGAGLEALLANNLTFKLEYLYTDLGGSRQGLGYHIDDPDAIQQSVSRRDDVQLHQVRIGLNLRFGAP